MQIGFNWSKPLNATIQWQKEENALNIFFRDKKRCYQFVPYAEIQHHLALLQNRELVY
jgi:hypothetical protein